MSEEQKKRIRELDEKAARELEKTDPSYAEHRKKLGLDADLRDKEQLAVVRKIVDQKAEDNELRDENLDLKAKLEIISELEITKKLDKYGVKSATMREKFLAHPDQFEAYVEGLNKEGQNNPSGANWVNPDYNNSQQPSQQSELAKKVYPSYEAMLEDLHDREGVFAQSKKGLEATRMLEAVTRRFFEHHKETNSPVPVWQKPMPELINVNGLLTPKNPDDADLQARNKAFRRRKLLEREERDSVNVNDNRRDSNYRRRED
jgi:hypothetical protein